MSTTEPIAALAPALAALEPLAAALLADLAARGVPADELPEVVVLALAAQQERINDLHAICRALHGRLERAEDVIRRSGDIPVEEYQRRVERLGLSPYWGMVDFAGNPLPDDGSISAVVSGGAITSIGNEWLVWPGEQIDSPPHLPRSEPILPDTYLSRSDQPDPPAAPPEAPRFRHDCESCVFLGRSADGRADLYFCEHAGWETPHLTARWGVRSGAVLVVDVDQVRELAAPQPQLAEAYRRAVAAGLVGEEGGVTP